MGSISHRTSRELIAVAERLARVFAIGSPFAPGFHCIGGDLILDDDAAAACGMPRLSVTGNGETLEAALISCLGETVDHLSQFERPGDAKAAPADGAPDVIASGWIAAAISGKGKAVDWVEARAASTRRPALLPADICLRRPPAKRVIEPIGPLSSGVAAGPTFEAAALRAVLELCERDAAALWWLGGRRPRRFPLEHSANQAGTGLIERLRGGETTRSTLLLDITSDVEVPTVAAVSLDADGRGMACGMAARQGWQAAVQAAILEMCQMEMAVVVVEAKRAESGEASLNEIDRRHLRRAAFAAADCDLLRPCGISPCGGVGTTDDGSLDALIGPLAARGVDIFLVDLTRPELNVPVARAVSPQLQPFASTIATERYVRIVSETGGGDAATLGTPLL